MDSQIQTLNLQRFMPFLAAVACCPCTLAIFTHSGQHCTKNPSQSSTELKVLIDWFDSTHFDWTSLFADNHCIEISDNQSVLLNPLKLGATQQEYWLAVLMDLPIAQLSIIEIQRIKLVIQQLSFCISEDYITAITMSGMAEELAVRYEELNLLYGLDESQDYLSSKNEYDALNQLISNCTDYLDVNLIALFILEQNVDIHQLINPHSNTNVPLILSELQGPLLHWMKSNNETLVINRDADTDWTDANINIPYKIIATPLLKESGNLAGILMLVNDLEAKDFTNSDRKLSEVLAIEAAMLIRARHDSLTELLNRKGFYEKLESAFEQVQAQGKMYSLIFLDVDQFKIVNDTSGQKAGDKLLIQIGALVKKELGSTDVIARLGADEFAILLDGYSLTEASKKAEVIKQIINQFRFIYELRMYDIALSIGVVWLDPAAKNISELLSAADLACRMAKEKGGNRVHIYHPSDQELLVHENQMQWISRINHALIEQRFHLYKQRILPLKEGDPHEHYELLIRLKDENGQIVSPIQFIPAAERYGLMTKLDRWVVKTALAKMADFYKNDEHCNLVCSINLSGQSFCEQGFLEYLINQVTASRLPPTSICFEITETVAVSNLSQTIEFMQAVKKIGCKFSLDDFGSGMSSFTYLKNLPVDYLKIDGYFVKSILENKIDYAMVQAINQIGQVMGLQTIAEFVENDAILTELKKIGVDYGQGYGIGEPEPF